MADIVVDTHDVEAWVNACRSKLFSGDDLARKVDVLLEMKVENEIIVQGYLRQGIECGKVTVERGMELLCRSKDTIGELVKARQLLAGKATEIVGKDSSMTDEVSQRLEVMMGGAVKKLTSLQTVDEGVAGVVQPEGTDFTADVVDNEFPTSVVDKLKVSGY